MFDLNSTVVTTEECTEKELSKYVSNLNSTVVTTEANTHTAMAVQIKTSISVGLPLLSILLK